MNGRERAIAWRHATHASVCSRTQQWEHGTVVFADDLPTFWAYNAVRVEGPDPGLDARELAAAADRLQAGLLHRQVEVEDVAAGERLRPGIDALGWFSERLVWMELEGPAHGAPAPVEISEVPLAQTRPLRRAWAGDWWATAADREGAARFMELEERVGERRGARALAVWGSGGEMIGFVAFVAGERGAEIDQVFVLPEHPGRAPAARW